VPSIGEREKETHRVGILKGFPRVRRKGVGDGPQSCLKKLFRGKEKNLSLRDIAVTPKKRRKGGGGKRKRYRGGRSSG